MGQTDLIFNAVDSEMNKPYQKAAKHGNAEALEWIVNKWNEHKVNLDIHDVDDHYYTALMHCCVKGYCGVETRECEDANRDRLACVKILIQQGSDVNFVSRNEKMTPLHWAAYHNDVEVVKLLLEHGAK